MKSILGLMVVVSLTTPVAAAELWWAVATAARGHARQAYGAAWNFPTQQQALEAAEEACRRDASRAGRPKLAKRCGLSDSGKNSCFFVIRTDVRYWDWRGSHFSFGGGYNTRAEAEADAKRWLADRPSGWTAVEGQALEMLECAGAE